MTIQSRPILTAAAILAGTVLALASGCKKSSNGPAEVAPATSEELAASLTLAVILPEPGDLEDDDLQPFALTAPPTDMSVTISSGSVDTMYLIPGAAAMTTITYVADEMANVTGLALGFGTRNMPPQQVMVVPLSTGVAMTGDLAVQFEVPSDFCQDLSQSCHDLRTYTYAVVDDIAVSEPYVRPIVFQCGACSDPACQTLLPDCGLTPNVCTPECPMGETCVAGTCVQSGQLRFTLVWDAEIDLDLHVITPDGDEIYWDNPEQGGCLLDVDNISGGPGAIENIACMSPEPGTWQFFVDNYSKVLGDNIQLSVVRADGQVLFQQQPFILNTQTPTFSIEIEATVEPVPDPQGN